MKKNIVFICLLTCISFALMQKPVQMPGSVKLNESENNNGSNRNRSIETLPSEKNSDVDNEDLNNRAVVFNSLKQPNFFMTSPSKGASVKANRQVQVGVSGNASKAINL